ncbi:LRRN4 C-terminal-like protein [Notolabrus celidotus]|uniref:LRRN4 C-terminal-like protein n=1 Tax=Notolabrus celidotus TaxID=1203425 RepID=UPI00148FD698|nr:LRRN4 C-terminal-like protein [Notolabrus celidotus]
MMPPCRNLTALLLFLCASPALHIHLFTNAASTSPPVTRSRIKYTDFGPDDYDEDISSPDVVSQSRTTVLQHKPQQPCKYDACSEKQEPCEILAERNGCLCPGISRADEPPHAPRIHALKPVSAGADRGKIEIQWCAPSSVVSRYRVVIEGSEGDSMEFKDVSRRGVIRSVEVGTKVCVEAVNKAGSSSPSEFSCMRFDHSESSDRKLLAGVIGGGVALLLILIIAAVILWKYKMHKKAKGDSTDGLGNPSYSTEGTL